MVVRPPVPEHFYTPEDPADDPEERDQDPEEAPETPPDEPQPPRVQDPPAEPDRKGPYVVLAE